MIGRLHPADLEELADLLADRLADRLQGVPAANATAPALVDVKTLAATLGVSPDFVREHAGELGGFRIADAARSPWRFDVNQARDRMAARTSGKRSPRLATPAPRSQPARQARRSASPAGRVLAIRGSEA